jgi:transcriptional regulator of acetoin/glycerol metabolism
MERVESEQDMRCAAAREEYFYQGRVVVGDLPTSVRRSWQRCLAAGSDPKCHLEFAMVGRGRVAELEERSRLLTTVARSELERVAAVVHRSGMVVLLADETGAIVRIAGDTRTLSPRLTLAARRGVDLSEEAVGTNAIGTALIDRSPVSIVAKEHFFEANAGLSCIAAPLFGPTGSLVGALDVSWDHRPSRPDCTELVRTAACAIENALLRELRGVMFLAISSHEHFLGTPAEGLLAFDPGGRLVAANGRARAFLGIAQADRPAFNDLFESVRFSEVVDGQTPPDRPLPLTSVTGLRFAARSSPAVMPRLAPAPGRPQPVTAASNDGAKNASALALLQVVTADPQTGRTFANARRAMDRDVPVLLAGETGTGKELFARALHSSGPRSDRAFVAVDCAALPESLIEGELFGYGEGAFTGARRGGAAGKIESADGGTLFLDEIGDMPLSLQTRLLRILQERAVVRLGESRERPIDIALVCASNRNLRDLVTQRLFREDLYYRINGLQVTLPPLRERANVLQLAEYFLWSRDRFKHGLELSPAAKEIVLQHSWPGNLRELDHAMMVAAAFRPQHSCIIEKEHLPDDFAAPIGKVGPPSPTLPPVTLDQAATDLIERTVLAHGGNVAAAARALKVSRSTIYSHWKRTQQASR